MIFFHKLFTVFLTLQLLACTQSSEDTSHSNSENKKMRIEMVGEMIVPASQHRDAILENGEVLLTGGQSGEGGIRNAQIYNPETKEFRALPSMIEARFVHAMNKLPDGRILVTGGFNKTGQFLQSSEIFDGEKFIPGPDLIENRDNQRTINLADGKIFIEGGDNEQEGYISSTEIFDPLQKAFLPGPRLPTGRAMDTISVYDENKILMAGGLEIINFTIHFLAETVIYDPSLNSIKLGHPLNEARKQHRATTLPDGRILITGGINDKGNLKSAELYSKEGVKFTADMLYKRSEHCSVLLNNGNVLIIGGYTEGGYNNTTEIFNTKENNFTQGPSLRTARAFPTCTLLKDGSVLISGGTGDSGALKSAELFIMN